MRQYLSSPISYLLSLICRSCGSHRKSGFTLIEMVAVILIIALLMAATVTGLTKARNNAWRIQARDTCRQICEAWNAYLLDEREFPSMPEGAETTYDNLKEILGISTDADETKTVYLELKESERASGESGGLRDHWKQLYHFSLDTDYDGKVVNPYPAANGLSDGNVKATSIAWSLGSPKYDKRDDRKIVVW